MTKKLKVLEIIRKFNDKYPNAICSLNHLNALELLVATQLSAQCTDERVNIVTKTLFEKYKSIDDYADANLFELENDIRSTGFYRNKSRNLINCCNMLRETYNSEIPDDIEDLVKLPGVGRKTANVVLGTIFNIPGIVVDTHTKRLSNRIGLTKNKDPEKIEQDLMKIVPKESWSKFSHQLVYHGRAVCIARKPNCLNCEIKNYCEYIYPQN